MDKLTSPLPEGKGILRGTCGGFFITGTDTGVGKTRISLGMMRALQQQGLSVTGMKPVASGCEMSAEGLRNEDALLLQQYASVPFGYETINPYTFAPPIAPHLAAARAEVRIELAPITKHFNTLAARSDAVVVEGAGGWQVPLNDKQSIADLAVQLGLPVILVVTIRLGCINHALLSAEAIRASGCRLAGWCANHTTPADPESVDIIHSINERIAAPMLAVIGYQTELNLDVLAQSIDTTVLMQSLAR